MFERIARSWELMKQSWQVLKSDKELLLFPVFSSIAFLFVVASFALPFVLSPALREAVNLRVSHERIESQEYQGDSDTENLMVQHQEEPRQVALNARQIVPTLVGFAFYLATSFVIVFFNTALVCCAMIRFSGGNPTIGDGLRAAIARLPQIFGWVLLSATVGTILRAIEERVPLIGKIVVGFVGMAWAAVTFMVVPILAAEQLGPFAAVKRSASLLRKTWGEALVGQVSLAGIQMLFMLPIFVGALVMGLLSASLHSMWPFAIAGGVAVLYVVMLAIVFSTLQQIFLAAVYQYAADGTVPNGFSQELIESAFKPKGT